MAGWLLFLGALLLYLFGRSPLWKFRYITFWIPPLAVALSIVLGRPAHRELPYPFGVAFRKGLLAAFVLASTKAMLIYLLIFLRPQIIEMHMEEIRQDLALVYQGPLASSLPADPADFLNQLKRDATPLRLAFAEFQMNLMAGLVLSVIFGFIFQRKSRRLPSHDPS